jgi:hypothetical protein
MPKYTGIRKVNKQLARGGKGQAKGWLRQCSADYFSIGEDAVKHLESHWAVVGGNAAHASGDFASLAPPALPVSSGAARF